MTSRGWKKLKVADYMNEALGSRILTCGEGQQIGHPGREVTRKPRAVDTFPEGIEFRQVGDSLNFMRYHGPSNALL